MAFDPLQAKGKTFEVVGGVDEASLSTSIDPTLNSVNGSFPFFYGMHQRMFGKKIIDFNPDQAVYGIHQTFNGICLYGYYVQTVNKLYYHLCSAPPDLRIHFFTP